jgi:hypothetical protein
VFLDGGGVGLRLSELFFGLKGVLLTGDVLFFDTLLDDGREADFEVELSEDSKVIY